MSKPEFVYTTYIETTPEKLWLALTDGDFTERYWFGARLRSDWKVGSSFEMVRSSSMRSGVRPAAFTRARARVVAWFGPITVTCCPLMVATR